MKCLFLVFLAQETYQFIRPQWSRSLQYARASVYRSLKSNQINIFINSSKEKKKKKYHC